MPSSMTAFARATKEYEWGTLVWELRSVNHRFLEPHFRLPSTQRMQEPVLREILRNSLSRGKLDVNLQLELSQQGSDLVVDENRVRDYLRACDTISAMMSAPAPLSAHEILQVPGVLQAGTTDRETILGEAEELFKTALKELIESRQREGEALKIIIVQHLGNIDTEASKVRQQLPQLLQAQRAKLQQKLSEVAVSFDTDRLEQEMVYHAQRADVSEELDRLDTHLKEFIRTLSSKKPIGRRLDFLCQELNREANTLASKSLATETTQAAIEIKVLIEQIREQVQNLE